jgi:hypothetical protein
MKLIKKPPAFVRGFFFEWCKDLSKSGLAEKPVPQGPSQSQQESFVHTLRHFHLPVSHQFHNPLFHPMGHYPSGSTGVVETKLGRNMTVEIQNESPWSR